MAHLLEKSERCSVCGTAPWEWDEKEGGSRDAYTTAVHQCMGCYHVKVTQQDEDLMPGASIVLRPKPKRRKLHVALPS